MEAAVLGKSKHYECESRCDLLLLDGSESRVDLDRAADTGEQRRIQVGQECVGISSIGLTN